MHDGLDLVYEHPTNASTLEIGSDRNGFDIADVKCSGAVPDSPRDDRGMRQQRVGGIVDEHMRAAKAMVPIVVAELAAEITAPSLTSMPSKPAERSPRR